MTDFRTPLTMCWHCDRPLDAASDLDGNHRPEPGAVSMCMYCGAIGIFGDDMRLEKPTEEIFDQVFEDRGFQQAFFAFQKARQYLMLRQSLLGYEAEHRDD